MLFDLHTYKASFTRILLVTGIDIVLFVALVGYTQPIPEVAIIIIPAILALFIVNICMAVVCRFVWKKLYLAFALNSILAPLIFYFALIGWYAYRDHDRFYRWKFDTNGKSYELTLSKQDTTYSLSELYKSGSSIESMNGAYTIRGDTMYLKDMLSPMAIYKDTLTGFMQKKVALEKE